MKDWEKQIIKDRLNQWLVTTVSGKFVCKKLDFGIFMIKDGENTLIHEEVLESVQL